MGLPRKKRLTGPVAFENLIPETKEKITLSWFIGETECLDVLRGKKITKDMVEVIPENVNNVCISECVCLASIKKFLTDDAWKIVINIVTRNYFCPVCKLQIDNSRDDSINCNSCLMRLHLKCTGPKKMLKKRYPSFVKLNILH